MEAIDVPQRVWDRIHERSYMEGECLVSGQAPGGHGYPQIGWRTEAGKFVVKLVHRLMWEQQHGPVPAGMVLRRSVCDNPRCIRVDHMTMTSKADCAISTFAK